MIQVLNLGHVDYNTALELQKTLVDLRKREVIQDTLLLLEHPPVITLGRNAKEKNIVASPELLTEKGVELIETDRGGDVTRGDRLRGVEQLGTTCGVRNCCIGRADLAAGRRTNPW